ncbi:MAG TPA: LCP family protein [Actinomycetota bacterium]
MTDASASNGAPSPKRHGHIAHWLVGISASLALVIGAGSAYGFVAYLQARTVGGGIPLPSSAPPSPGDPVPDDPCARDICNYLLLGSDSRAGLTAEERDQFGNDQQIGGENRADTIMLVHTDPALEKAIILSFPRDLWVTIPGKGSDKINAAFEGGVDGGGPAKVAETVQQLTGLHIDHVLYVDLAGFQGVVETLGGVDMCITGENVNTPGYVEGEGESIYYEEPGYIADPLTGLHVKPGCQTLPADQALAYVRTRHLKCDGAAPDFYRITRQQQFLRAVINKVLQPDELAQLPLQIKPIMANLRRDDGLKIADLAYLVGQLSGIDTGATEFRTVPGTPAIVDGLAVIKLSPSANQIFRAVREGRQLGAIGEQVFAERSPATIPVLLVDHASGDKIAGVATIVSDSGFDITPGSTTFDEYGKKVQGDVIAYAPGNEAQAQVVAKYFPSLKTKQVKGLPDDVAVFITSDYEPVPVGSGTSGETGCPDPDL